jgi:hypothetical protein
MYQGFDAAGEKVWGCSLCSYAHKELVAFFYIAVHHSAHGTGNFCIMLKFQFIEMILQILAIGLRIGV